MANNEVKHLDESKHLNTKDFVIGAIIGGVVGAATALFLAPKSGKDLRNDVSGQFISLKDKTDDLRVAVTQKGNDLAAATKEKTIQLKDKAVDAGNKLKETVKEQKEKMLKNDEVETEEEFI